MLTAAALAAVLLAAPAGHADSIRFPVVIVPGLELADLERLRGRGAVALLVPGAGPTVSERTARAALVRGKVENSLLGGIPSGSPLIPVATGSAKRVRPPVIVLALPRGGEQANDRRYPIAVLGGEYRGILTSKETRIPGLVSIADVAPTAIGREDALGSE
ncbi:MAG: hypothetical protein M3292_12435, partial [Actinomycetota bacterium]|nr:hypothetical protein [Actinomycetota bacterium]